MAMTTGTVVLPCSCFHPGQDERYGKGNRLHNCGPKSSPSKGNGARCTVCDKAKSQ